MTFMDMVFNTIAYCDELFWGYIGWILITIAGIYLTVISRGLQFRALASFRHNLNQIFSSSADSHQIGIHPLKLYFASVGGMVGLGNIVFISTAIVIGGPGSIFWMIVASICGMLLKYSEIYLGVKYRIKNDQGGFDGGPMYFLQHAFKSKKVAYLFAFLLCLYGVEISNFLVLVNRIESSFNLDKYLVIGLLLIAVIYTAIGGINRLANICSVIMPVFMLSYIFICLYIIADNASALPNFFWLVASSAFSEHAVFGGFAGSTMVMAAYYGISKTVYSGDIGIGYDSIVQSTTRLVNPKMQATMAIYALLTDTIICLLTNITLGVTGAWYKLNHVPSSDIVATVLADYLPYSDYFVTLLLFFAGFTTIIAYLAAGTKCANFISPKYGRTIYLLYAIFAFIFFCNFSQEKVITIMSLLSGLLVLLNVTGIIRLKKQIEF